MASLEPGLAEGGHTVALAHAMTDLTGHRLHVHAHVRWPEASRHSSALTCATVGIVALLRAARCCKTLGSLCIYLIRAPQPDAATATGRSEEAGNACKHVLLVRPATQLPTAPDSDGVCPCIYVCVCGLGQYVLCPAAWAHAACICCHHLK